MKHRTLALLLAVALTLCLPCTTALAAEEPLPPDNSAAQTGDGPTPEAYIPDPEGTVTFQNLDRRIYRCCPSRRASIFWRRSTMIS